MVPLFAIALLTIAGSLYRRRWDLALMFSATVTYVLFHAALLSFTNRYALSMSTIWYAAVAIVPAIFRSMQWRAPSQQTGHTPNGVAPSEDV